MRAFRFGVDKNAAVGILWKESFPELERNYNYVIPHRIFFKCNLISMA